MKKTSLLISLLFSIFNVTAQKTADEKVMFIDTHNDVLSKQITSGADLAIGQPLLNFDLPKANKGNLGAQVFSIWCDEIYGSGKAFARANQEIDSLLAFTNRNPGKVAFVTNSKQLKKKQLRKDNLLL